MSGLCVLGIIGRGVILSKLNTVLRFPSRKRNMRPRFSNSTLEYVVEGVQELDISESPKVIYIDTSYLIIL